MKITDTVSKRFLAAIGELQAVRRRELKNKSIVYGSFVPGKVYVVEKGYVRMVSAEPDGRNATRAILGRGAILGDLPFVPTTFKDEEFAVCSGATCVLEFERAAIEATTRHDEIFCQILLEIYGAQLQFLDRRLQWQLALPLHRRIAMTLVDLMCFQGQSCHHGAGYLMDVRMTHEEFSELVVAARPTVSAILSAFRDQGLISYTRAYLCVKNLIALGHIAETDSSLYAPRSSPPA